MLALSTGGVTGWELSRPGKYITTKSSRKTVVGCAQRPVAAAANLSVNMLVRAFAPELGMTHASV